MTHFFNIIFCILSLSAHAFSSEVQELMLVPGEQHTLAQGASVWVENGEVVKVTQQGVTFIVEGKKSGVSEVRVGSHSYRVQVLSLAHKRALEILSPLVKKTLGLTLATEGGKTKIKGRLVQIEDWQRLTEACRQKTCSYWLTASFSEDIGVAIQHTLAQELQRRQLPPLPLHQEGGLRVTLNSNSRYLKAYQESLGPMGIDIQLDPASLEMAPLIKVQITVAEVKRDGFLNYGVQWPETYSAQILPVLGGSIAEQRITAQFLEHKGLARILASPNLLCRSGKEAEFMAGGEFPIKIINLRVQDVVWKKYGILLKVKPTADFSGRMSIELETEVSSIDPARSVDGIPGIFANRVQSHFDLPESRTIALSGLIKNEDSSSMQGLPYLRQIPILGALFSSREFKENRTELVIFVKPEVINEHP